MKIAFLLLVSSFAYAYPENSRHGYVNCTTCHLSPSGGGLLTPYGHELSKEILSTWSNEGEQNFAYGKIPTSEQVLLGAFIRGLQVQSESADVKEAETILMQADFDMAYNAKQYAVMVSGGRQEIRDDAGSRGRAFSRRHYAIYRPSEPWSVRVGKFLRYYGLNEANHNILVRRNLGFGFDTETLNFEVAYLGDNWSSYLTFLDGTAKLQVDDTNYLPEKASTFSTSYYFMESQKVGVSLYHGDQTNQSRDLLGAWAVLSLSQKCYLLSEFDFQGKKMKDTGDTTSGFVQSHRLNYEWRQGVITYATGEQSFLNNSDPTSELRSYGLGLQLFPRPHYEIVAAWQNEEAVVAKSKTTFYWLMVHLYL